MNKLFSTITLIAGIAFWYGAWGCKKTNSAAKPNCRIISVIAGANGIVLNYNTDGKLSEIKGTVSNKLAYNGNTIIITNATGNIINTITTVTLNANGLASNASVADSTGKKLSNIAYEYNGIELSRSVSTQGSGTQPFITTYTWNGGNMVSSQAEGLTTSYDYAPDIPAQAGDFWGNTNLQQGYETLRTKNAVRKISTPATVFNYSLDTDGKINSFVAVTNGTVISFSYGYECR